MGPYSEMVYSGYLNLYFKPAFGPVSHNPVWVGCTHEIARDCARSHGADQIESRPTSLREIRYLRRAMKLHSALPSPSGHTPSFPTASKNSMTCLPRNPGFRMAWVQDGLPIAWNFEVFPSGTASILDAEANMKSIKPGIYFRLCG